MCPTWIVILICFVTRVELHERKRKIRWLLSMAEERYPTVTRPQFAPAGPVPSNRVPCQDCRKYRGRICPVCDGYGWRKRRDWDEWYDEYTGEMVEVDRSQQSTGDSHKNKRLARRAKGYSGTSVQERFVCMRESGSFTLLRRTIERIPSHLKLLPLDDERVVEWLALNAGGRLYVPKAILDEWRKEDDSAIVALVADGWPELRVAKHLGLSVGRVGRVLRRQDPPKEVLSA